MGNKNKHTNHSEWMIYIQKEGNKYILHKEKRICIKTPQKQTKEAQKTQYTNTFYLIQNYIFAT